jgi:hypothetical protein
LECRLENIKGLKIICKGTVYFKPRKKHEIKMHEASFFVEKACLITSMLDYLPIKMKIPEIRAKIPMTIPGIATPAIAMIPYKIKKIAKSNIPIFLVIMTLSYKQKVNLNTYLFHIMILNFKASHFVGVSVKRFKSSQM